MARQEAALVAGISAILIVTLLLWVTMAVHEAGHAIAARGLGLRVSSVTIGRGRELASVRLGRTRVSFRLAPIGGSTSHRAPIDRAPALRSALTAAAGPAANLALAGGLYWWRTAGDPSPLLSAVISAAVVFSLFVGLANLLPIRKFSTTGRPSDGWIVLSETMHLPEAQLRRRTAANASQALELVRQAKASLVDGIEDATTRCLEALHLDPLPPPARTVVEDGLAGILADQSSEARRIAAERIGGPLLVGSLLTNHGKGGVANSLAWAAVAGGGEIDAATLLTRAEERARLAQLLTPSAATEDTLALVLIRARQFPEAWRWAIAAGGSATTSPAADRAGVACIHALAALGLGRPQEAIDQQHLAQSLDPTCHLLPEVARALAEAAGSNPMVGLQPRASRG